MYFPDQLTGNPTPKRDASKYDPDIVVISYWWDELFWSLKLQAPIGYFMSFKFFNTHRTDPGEKPYFIISLMSSIRHLIKDNKAGPNGECLTLEEIQELYKAPPNE
jgi:hypothetical protein